MSFWIAPWFKAVLSYITLAAPYLALGALVLAIVGIGFAYWLHRRMRLLTLRRGDSLEDTLGELTRRARELQTFREELEVYLKGAETRIQKSVQGIGVVRFNPFEGDGSGGNQSFSAAFVDEHGDGIVLSAIYSRTGQTSVYGKPLLRGTSTFELTDEEREAIRKATAPAEDMGAKKKLIGR